MSIYMNSTVKEAVITNIKCNDTVENQRVKPKTSIGVTTLN